MIYHMSGGGGAPITPPAPTNTIAPSNWTVTSEYSLPRGKVLADTKKSATASLPTQTGSAPSIGVSANGLITSSYSVPSGKLLSSGASASAQLATQGGYTVMPGTSDVTAVAQGRYTTGNIYVKGDSNLVSSNIISGKSIFGVSGSVKSVNDVGQLSWTLTSISDSKIELTFPRSATILYVALRYKGTASWGKMNRVDFLMPNYQIYGYSMSSFGDQYFSGGSTTQSLSVTVTSTSLTIYSTEYMFAAGGGNWIEGSEVIGYYN